MKHKRKLIRGLLNNKKRQFNYAVWNILASVLLISIINTVFIFKFSKTTDLCANGAMSTISVSDYFQFLIVGSIIAILLTAAASFFFAILVTHRFFGPLVPILRHIEALRQGQYSGRIRLRRKDELQELSDKLNLLTEELERNSQSSALKVKI